MFICHKYRESANRKLRADIVYGVDAILFHDCRAINHFIYEQRRRTKLINENILARHRRIITNAINPFGKHINRTIIITGCVCMLFGRREFDQNLPPV